LNYKRVIERSMRQCLSPAAAAAAAAAAVVVVAVGSAVTRAE